MSNMLYKLKKLLALTFMIMVQFIVWEVLYSYNKLLLYKIKKVCNKGCKTCSNEKSCDICIKRINRSE